MALMTAEQARLYIRGIQGTAEDVNIATLVARADSVFASFLGIPAPTTGGNPTIEDTAHTLYLDGPGGQALQVPYMPIQSITSIHDSTDRTYGSGDLVASADYDVYGSEGLVQLKDTSTHGSWSGTTRAIKVIAVIGWATIPEAIQHAAGLQAAFWFKNRDQVGYSSINQGGGSVSIAALGLLPEVQEALQPYRQASTWTG
jgi:hypothetical protein